MGPELPRYAPKSHTCQGRHFLSTRGGARGVEPEFNRYASRAPRRSRAGTNATRMPAKCRPTGRVQAERSPNEGERRPTAGRAQTDRKPSARSPQAECRPSAGRVQAGPMPSSEGPQAERRPNAGRKQASADRPHAARVQIECRPNAGRMRTDCVLSAG